MPLLIKKHSKLRLTIYHKPISALSLLYLSYRDMFNLSLEYELSKYMLLEHTAFQPKIID